MTQETAILLFSLLTNLVALIVIILVYQSEKTLDKFRPYLKDIEELKAETAKEERKFLREAIISSREILEDASGEVKKILKLSRKMKKEVEEKVTAAIDETLAKTLSTFQNSSNYIISEYQNRLAELSKSQADRITVIVDKVEKEAINQIHNLMDVAENQVLEIRKQTQAVVEEERTKVKEELEAYKKEKVRQFNERIYQIIKETAKVTIGKALNMSEHQDLVLTSLEKVKKGDLFNGQ